MGCGVAGLAGFSCDWFANIFLAIYALDAVGIMLAIAKLGDRKKIWRNELIGIAVILSPFAWAHFSGLNELAAVRAQLQEYQTLCYEKAYEKIHRPAQNMKLLVISPPSEIKDRMGFELFYGARFPNRWAGVEVASSIDQRARSGAYELRYTYIPENRLASGTQLSIWGVHQQIFDLERNELIAERLNFATGDEFRRSGSCLSSRGMMSWYDGNGEFADRVLGYRYNEPGKPARKERAPEWHIKASLIGEDNVKADLPPQDDRNLVFEGESYRLNVSNEPPALGKEGNWRLREYLKYAPSTFMSIVAHDGGYFIVGLPNGNIRNRPPREMLFVFLSRDAEETRRLYAQIPPGIHWIDGWGLNPAEVTVSGQSIRFQLYGKKRRTGKYSDQNNEGHYTKHYLFSVPIPWTTQSALTPR